MAGTKRKAAAGNKAESSKETKQPKVDGQKAVSRDVNIPIDEGFGQFGRPRLHKPLLKACTDCALHADSE